MSNHQSAHIDLAQLAKRAGSHSIFSPSSSAMWFNCSGSLVAHMQYPDTAGEDAAEGTVAHGVAERWLKTGVRPNDLVGTIERVDEGEQVFLIEITESMLDFVQEYVDRCMFLPGSHYVETRVDFSDLTPIKNQSGTADHAACSFQHLVVSDLKFGRGILVRAKDNTQAILYAYGFFKQWDWLYDFQTITIRIIQPRLDNFDEWTITRAELIDWAERIKERAHAAWCQNGERTPGVKQCEWCRAKSDCAAHAVFLNRLLDGVFENLDDPVTAEEVKTMQDEIDDGVFALIPVPVGTLTTAQKAAILPFRKMIESWFAEIYADLEQRCFNGEDVPGYKEVVGRSDRTLVDEQTVLDEIEFLGIPSDKLYTKKMIGIGDLEKLIVSAGYKRKDLPDLLKKIVRKPPGKRAMAPTTDKRTAVSVATAFDNLDAEL